MCPFYFIRQNVKIKKSCMKPDQSYFLVINFRKTLFLVNNLRKPC